MLVDGLLTVFVEVPYSLGAEIQLDEKRVHFQHH